MNAIERANLLDMLIEDVKRLQRVKSDYTNEDFLALCCKAVTNLANNALMGSSVADLSIENQSWYERIVLSFREAGITVLGSGYFSMAVTLEALAGRVIKLGFKKEDSGAAYAAYSIDRIACGKQLVGVDFDNVPKVEFMRRYENCYAVVMPKYQTFNEVINDTQYRPTDRMFLKLQFEIAKGLIDFGKLDGNKTIEGFAMMAGRYCKGFEEMQALLQVCDTRKEALESFMIQCKNIRTFFKDIAAFDTHDENVMVKWVAGQAHLVITDPVSFTQYDGDDY